MATKSITITQDAYERLKQEKQEDESFSHVIKRLTSNAGRLLRFAGSLSEEKAARLQARINENKKRQIKIEKEKWKQMKRDLHGLS